MYALTLLAPPAGEPVSLAEAKLHVRQDASDDDSLIMGLIVAARMQIEAEIGRALVSSTWQMDFDRFPAPFAAVGDWRGRPYGAWGVSPQDVTGHLRGPDFAMIRIPRSPLQQVLSVTYLDVSGNTQTVDASTYVVKRSDPGVIAPAFGKYWPPARFQIASISVQFVAGYGPVTTIAASISPGTRTVTPASMVGVYVGTVLGMDPGLSTWEQVVVTAVTSTTFTAVFAQTHGPGCSINCVPETLRLAAKLLVGHWYENREAVIAGAAAAAMPLPLAYQSLTGANWNGEY